VNVDVIHNAGSCRVTQVHTDIESRGRISFAKCSLGTFSEIHQLIAGLFRDGIKITNMIVGNDEQVTASVGINIEDNEIVRGPMQNEILFVALSLGLKDTKDTSP
jgi:hypothetical protein